MKESVKPTWEANMNTLNTGHRFLMVTCLATDACLTADPALASSIPARSNTFVEIDHDIIPPL